MVLTVAAIAAGTASFLQSRPSQDGRDRAKAHAKAVANELDGAMGTSDLDHALDEQVVKDLNVRLQHALSSDGEDVAAVRVWAPDGSLRYSSVDGDKAQPDMNALERATNAGGRPASSGGTGGALIDTYVPLRAGRNGDAFGAVQVTQAIGRGAAEPPQLPPSVRPIAVAVGALMLVLLLLSLVPARKTRTREGKSVGFVDDGRGERKVAPAQEAAPREIEDDRATAKLARAEAPRQASEMEMDQLRAQLTQDRERAGERIAHLESSLQTTAARLHEAQAAGASRSAEQASQDRASAQRIRELDQALQAERLRSGSAEARLTGLEAQLKQMEAQRKPASGEEQAVNRTVRELEAALERAREAEDRAAALHDRLQSFGHEGTQDGGETSEPSEEPSSIDALVDSPDDDEGGSPADLRSRLSRAAARKRGKGPSGSSAGSASEWS